MPTDDTKPAEVTPAPAAPVAPTPPPAAEKRGTVDVDSVIKDHGARLARVEAAVAPKKDAEAPAPPAPSAPAPKRRVRTMLD